MSLSKHSRNPPKPKYCKVCHDAGKEEKVYTSHFIRESPDPASKVVCPTLLALECKYCFKAGHTIKYCAVLKKKNKQENNKTQEKKVVQRASVPEVNNNIYSLLDYCDDEVRETNIPEINQGTLVEPSVLSYRKIIDITNQQIIEQENERLRREAFERAEQQRKREEETIRQQMIAQAQVLKPMPTFRFRKMTNWADDSSDEEDLPRKQASPLRSHVLNWADDTSDEEVEDF
jgi:hypothetical protein